MKDTDEPSPASAGSHVELHRAVRELLDGVNARYAKNPREWTCPHMQALDDMTQSEPQPTITDEERHAIAVVRNCAMVRAERFLTQSDAEMEATLVLWRLRERLD